MRLLGIAGIAATGLFMTACNKGAPKLETQKDKVSYIIGQNIGRSFKQQNLEADLIDLKKLSAGIEDALAGKEGPISQEQMAEIMNAFQQQMMAHADSMNKVKGEGNKKAGEDFLAKNAKEPGVVTLPSGLQYKVLKEGKGDKPKATSMVTVHYTGTLIDGKEFDSSRKRGQPATFPVNGVIAGWTEALQLMTPGAHWMLYIPSNLAYGDRAAGPEIGPNSTLIFDVELISVN
jgi:FKBP-type peptidyl-prolyl cis-trans isomerase FklB